MQAYFDQITEILLVQSYITLFFVSFTICLVVILSSSYGFSRRALLDEVAIQSAHSGIIPRVGGLAVYISILVLIPLLSFGFIPLSVVFGLNAEELTWLILSATPVFLIGLAEDLDTKCHLGAPNLPLPSQVLLHCFYSKFGYLALVFSASICCLLLHLLLFFLQFFLRLV